MVVAGAKPIPHLKSVVVARVGRCAKAVATANPAINQKATKGVLIACRSKQCSHLCEGACVGGCRVVGIATKHRQIRKVTKNKGVFPNDTALVKLVYLAYRNARKKWTMPVPNWGIISQQLAIKFEDRYNLL